MRFALTTATLLTTIFSAQQPPPWVAKSNENAGILLKVMAKYDPEGAGELGLSGLDEQISIPALETPERRRHDTAEAVAVLQSRLAAEQSPLVKQDLEILIQSGQRDIRASRADEQHLLPYLNVGRMIFSGEQVLLNPQVAPDRRKAALVRLRRYTGLEKGYTPTTLLAEQIFRQKLKTSGLLGPSKAEVDQDLATMRSYVEGIGQLLKKFNIAGYQEAYGKLKDQLAQYEAFVRTEVLPHARTDFRLPPELYAIRLENAGVDYQPAELVKLAHQSFWRIQQQMQDVARKVASEHGFASSDYRDVIRQLKQNQIPSDRVMAVYHDTLARLEQSIRREHLVTLPARPCIIRIASAAETAEQPAPHYLPPPLIDNHGEQGQFVLPAGTTGANGKALKYDDFTFQAASWTLTAHEARPGHDLQFSAMVERGVSEARAIFAFNSVNVEGWGLYAEWFMYPYMPDDGKLISLQLRLMRAARAFLDPELQQGKLTRQQALDLLEKDVVLSEALATEEVDRYTFRMPGQAVSYFDGFTRLLQLRADIEKAMGSRFNVEQFHDFILAEGMLPPKLLREATMTRFVPAQAASN
jgi:uncharacterized protein (DUF885 family)